MYRRMIALKIVITVLFFLQTGFTQSPSPVNDAPCLEDQNNCPSNSYCYIYSVTGQPYCAQSCELNNGGCGTGQCIMVTVQCITAPCPPIVQCHSAAEICDLPSVVGDCDAAIRRFFFNSTSQRCEMFIYGGCGGNANNFIDQTECARTCQSGVSVVPTLATRSSSQSYSGSIIPTHVSRSSSHSHSRSYSGSVTSTRSARPTRPSTSHSATRISSTLLVLPSPSSVPWPGPYTCSLQPESGDCKAYFPSYFYNVTSGRCEMFIYGGCGGNDNRFSTSEECSRTCRNFVNICELNPETGVCEAYIPSYFYNATSKRCEEFIYGGCGGNDNRFPTLNRCQAKCDIDVCILEPEPGNCRAAFLRYFYNKFTGRCELFVYGGCGGNGNRFFDIRSCEKTCVVSSVPAISPTPVVSEKNIISVTVSSYDGDLDGLVADFTSDLMEILTNNGIKDVFIRIVDVLYTSDNDVILSVAVYSDKGAISGDKIAALINQNKEIFSVPVSDAVVGDGTNDSENSDDSDGVSGEALAGIVVGAIVGLIFVMLLAVGILYFINNRHRITTRHFSTKKSDGLNNPIYSGDQVE